MLPKGLLFARSAFRQSRVENLSRVWEIRFTHLESHPKNRRLGVKARYVPVGEKHRDTERLEKASCEFGFSRVVGSDGRQRVEHDPWASLALGLALIQPTLGGKTGRAARWHRAPACGVGPLADAFLVSHTCHE